MFSVWQKCISRGQSCLQKGGKYKEFKFEQIGTYAAPLGRACWPWHKALDLGNAEKGYFALMPCPPYHDNSSSASKFSKVSESGYKTGQRPKGSEGLPASLRRGPGGSLRNVNSVPAGLVHPPHTVGLVPVHVGLGGGISMTLVTLDCPFGR